MVAQMVKNLPGMQETQVRSLDWENPLEKGMAYHSLPGKFHGGKSLAGYSLGGDKELDTNKQLTLSLFPHLFIEDMFIHFILPAYI